MARPLHFGEKLRVATGWAVAIGLFAAVGWTAVRPFDPYAPATLVAKGGGWPIVLVTLIALSAVASALATVIAGSAMRHVGALATAIGLACMSLRGGTMTYLLLYNSGSLDERRRLAALLVVDALLWAAVVAAAWIVGEIVQRWVDGRERPTPVTRTLADRARGVLQHARDAGLGVVVCTAIAWTFITVTIARSAASPIERGQVIFAVGVGFFLGAMAGRYTWAKGAAVWYALSVLIVALIGYGWATVNPEPQGVAESFYRVLATTPPSSLFRPLPIEYVSVGLIGVLLGYRSGERMQQARIDGGTAE